MSRNKEDDLPYDWQLRAKAYAEAEQSLKIEKWVTYFFVERHADRSETLLYKLSMPCFMEDRWRWLIRWRKAKLICRYPKSDICYYTGYWDKRSGFPLGVNTCLSSLIASKAWVTRVEKSVEKYVKWQRQHNMFFDEQSDEQLLKVKAKIQQKKRNVQEAEERLEKKVKEIDSEINKYLA